MLKIGYLWIVVQSKFPGTGKLTHKYAKGASTDETPQYVISHGTHSVCI